MSQWNSFSTYQTKARAFPWWVSRPPMAVAGLLLFPLLLAAVAIVLVAVVLFIVLLILWRFLAFFGLYPSGPRAPRPQEEERVNVRVIPRDGE